MLLNDHHNIATSFTTLLTHPPCYYYHHHYHHYYTTAPLYHCPCIQRLLWDAIRGGDTKKLYLVV